MVKYIIFALVGALITVIGVLNFFGNISTVHKYNRRRVSEENVPKYGRCIGLGTGVIGLSIIVTAIVEAITENPLSEIAILIGCAIGIVMILYGQFKYNKGIF